MRESESQGHRRPKSATSSAMPIPVHDRPEREGEEVGRGKEEESEGACGDCCWGGDSTAAIRGWNERLSMADENKISIASALGHFK